MLRRIPKLVLLAALLAAFAASSNPAFGTGAAKKCFCVLIGASSGGRHVGKEEGQCHFDKKTSQCVNINCNGRGFSCQ